MKNSEVINRLLEFHPVFPEDYAGCDDYKAGDKDAECTGVAIALVPTVDVIKKASEMGCNLLVVHEPTFYSTPDFAGWKSKKPNQIYEEKQKLIQEKQMTIWRDHDHMHAHQPDCIFTGVEKYLGWEDFRVEDDKLPPMMYVYDLPEQSVGELAQTLKERIGLNGLRYVGRKEDRIRRVAIVGHLYPNSFGADGFDSQGYWHEYATDIMDVMESGVDAIIPGEIIDWTVLSYVRDAVELGKVKAVLNIGHFNMEELGMKYAADYMKDMVGDELKVCYIPSEDIYRFHV